MVKIYLDTNVVIDLLAKREPFYEDAKSFLLLVQNELALLFIAEISLGNLFYLAFEVYKIPQSREVLDKFFSVCKVISGGEDVVRKSLNSNFKDKEDGLQYYTALAHNMDFFITRNKKDFKGDIQIPVYTPKEFFGP
ncbi:PIN domain-containing protein [Algoriphagus faecimaris]|uniref:PIN domain-containing protein n=1 Tax=Algoriphagus faecimaris TaxID=686796 RepID=A0A1G6NWH1_9BACT|nr:PIN domain-containing protein [Algoriphagus faecimaris]SDC71596.1 PIN domain-containing protein [Algoriphagus faecimaris]